MTTTSHERRRFWRANFHAGAKLLTDLAEYKVQIEDLSLKGALVTLPEQAEIGPQENCRLQLTLADDVSITLWGRIAHVDGLQIGIRCESMDLDSVTHLRRLVELNLGDQDLLDRDFAALLTPKD